MTLDQAKQALEQSCLDVNKLSEEQKNQILDKLQSLPDRFSDTEDLTSTDWGCIGCEVGLNVLIAAPLLGVIAAGVTIGPEAAIVITVLGWLGTGTTVTAASIAIAINTALGVAGGATVEGIILAICQAIGACQS